jgi:hypothetical protein
MLFHIKINCVFKNDDADTETAGKECQLAPSLVKLNIGLDDNHTPVYFILSSLQVDLAK